MKTRGITHPPGGPRLSIRACAVDGLGDLHELLPLDRLELVVDAPQSVRICRIAHYKIGGLAPQRFRRGLKEGLIVPLLAVLDLGQVALVDADPLGKLLLGQPPVTAPFLDEVRLSVHAARVAHIGNARVSV